MNIATYSAAISSKYKLRSSLASIFQRKVIYRDPVDSNLLYYVPTLGSLESKI